MPDPEPNLAELPEMYPYRALAAAVVDRAFCDLLLTKSQALNRLYRQSAYYFLVDWMWQDDLPWGSLLAEALVREKIVGEARRRYRA